MNGLIITAHGSKKEISNSEVLDLVMSINKDDTLFEEIEPAFLEFAIPSIENVVETFLEKGIEKVFIYPYFLNSGKHVTFDLPNIVEQLQKTHKTKEFILLPHFGVSSMISKIVLNDIKDLNRIEV